MGKALGKSGEYIGKLGKTGENWSHCFLFLVLVDFVSSPLAGTYWIIVVHCGRNHENPVLNQPAGNDVVGIEHFHLTGRPQMLIKDISKLILGDNPSKLTSFAITCYRKSEFF